MPVRKRRRKGKSVTRLNGPITKPPVIILITRTLCNGGGVVRPHSYAPKVHTWLLLFHLPSYFFLFRYTHTAHRERDQYQKQEPPTQKDIHTRTWGINTIVCIYQTFSKQPATQIYIYTYRTVATQHTHNILTLMYLYSLWRWGIIYDIVKNIAGDMCCTTM